jgi:ribosomal protein L37AE/L43A
MGEPYVHLTRDERAKPQTCQKCGKTKRVWPIYDGHWQWTCPDCRLKFGPEGYEPTDWVKEVVGQQYRDGEYTYTCTGYWRQWGFWMTCVLEGGEVLIDTNVSERAIDRTFHRADQVW